MKVHFGHGPVSEKNLEQRLASWVVGCNVGFISELGSLLLYLPESQIDEVCRQEYDKAVKKYSHVPVGEEYVGYVRHFIASVDNSILNTQRTKAEAFFKIFPLRSKTEIRKAHNSLPMQLLVLDPPPWHKEVQ